MSYRIEHKILQRLDSNLFEIENLELEKAHEERLLSVVRGLGKVLSAKSYHKTKARLSRSKKAYNMLLKGMQEIKEDNG